MCTLSIAVVCFEPEKSIADTPLSKTSTRFAGFTCLRSRMKLVAVAGMIKSFPDTPTSVSIWSFVGCQIGDRKSGSAFRTCSADNRNARYERMSTSTWFGQYHGDGTDGVCGLAQRQI